MISTKEMLETMKNGKPFSMVVICYDRRRKSGGQIKEYPEAILVKKSDGNDLQLSRPQTKMEQKAAYLDELKKNPNHSKWYTRNIRLLQEGQPVGIINTIHPPLVVEFNGQKVVP